jgi:hypothetical protein
MITAITITAICCSAVVTCVGIVCYTVLRWNRNYGR